MIVSGLRIGEIMMNAVSVPSRAPRRCNAAAKGMVVIEQPGRIAPATVAWRTDARGELNQRIAHDAGSQASKAAPKIAPPRNQSPLSASNPMK